MKTIILFIILSIITLAQTDIRVKGELVSVKQADGTIVINEYIDSCRIETNQIVKRGNLSNFTPSDVEPLPEFGQWCEKNKLYAYNNQVIICIQSHARTLFRPEDTPNLFNFYRSGTDLQWMVNELVTKDDIRIYQGVKYKCLLGHTCILTWTPPATLGILWGVVQTTNEWAVGVAYKVNDEVTYLGIRYRCRQSHTSQNGWQPPNVPALWLKL